MEGHIAIPHIRELILFLVSAGIAVPLLQRLKVQSVLGYLAIGVVIGPYGLGRFAESFGPLQYAVISDVDGVKTLAELGVIFLLFMIGLELSLERLWAMRRQVFGLGTLQVVVCGAAIAGAANLAGLSAQASIVVGACFALSSTAIVMQMLIGNHQLGTPLGRASFSILLLQDLAVVPILLLVTVMGDKSGASTGMLLLKSLGQAVAAIVVIILIGRFLVRPAFKFVSQFRSPELFMAVTLLTILGLASLSAAAGLSMALGAFMAGLLLAETEYRHQIEVDIEPFKGLFLGLFFMSVGMGIDVAAIFDNAITLVVAVIVVMALKAAVTGALCMPFGLPRYTAMECGILLSQVSEFAFVVIGLGITFEVLPAKEGQLLLIIVSLTMLVTPTLSGFARKLAQSLEDKATQEAAQAHGAADDELKDHIIIAGFGRVGRTVARVFQGQNIKFVALDLHAESVARARAEKLPVYYGDASRSDIMERIHADRAIGLVLTMDDPLAVEHSVHEVRELWPQLPIFARARDTDHAQRLKRLGATEVVQETVEASLQLAGRVLEHMQLPDETLMHVLDQQRAQEFVASQHDALDDILIFDKTDP